MWVLIAFVGVFKDFLFKIMEQDKCRELTSDVLKDLLKDVDAILFDCDGILILFLFIKYLEINKTKIKLMLFITSPVVILRVTYSHKISFTQAFCTEVTLSSQAHQRF